MKANNSPLLTIGETAEMLRVSTRTVYNLIKDKKIAPKKIGGRRFFTKEQIEKYISES